MSSTNKKGAGLILSLLTAVAGAVGLAFCIVNASGLASNGDASYSFGVAPGFIIS